MSEVFVSASAHALLIEYIKELGHEAVLVDGGAPRAVYEAVASHPDIYMCKLGARPESPVYMGKRERLGFDYPENIRYNAAVFGKYFVHNLKYTDEGLLSAAKHFTKINVRQGYTKCNMVIVDDERCITSDRGIAKALAAAAPEIKTLLISEGQVLLPGFSCGFLGGASGRVGNRILFNGDLSLHDDFKRIESFISEAGLEIVYFKGYPLTDVGSLIERQA